MLRGDLPGLFGVVAGQRPEEFPPETRAKIVTAYPRLCFGAARIAANRFDNQLVTAFSSEFSLPRG